MPRDSFDICFSKYIRTGIEPNCNGFETKKIPHLYIWRAQLDDRVRKSHYDRDGKIFDDRIEPAPLTEHGCRCRAEYRIPIWVEIVN